jgi:hypothetical protein
MWSRLIYEAELDRRGSTAHPEDVFALPVPIHLVTASPIPIPEDESTAPAGEFTWCQRAGEPDSYS